MLSRQARSAQGPEEEDSYQSAPAPYPQFDDARDDSAGFASGPPASGAPDPATHAGGGVDHVDYGAYTGGYGAFGWYTDHPVFLGPGHRRKRQAPQEEENLDTAADAAYGAAVSRYLNTFTTNNHHLSFSLILSLWAGSRSRCTEAPARARDMRCSPPGVITILSLLASQYIIDLINSSKNVNKCIYFISVLSQPSARWSRQDPDLPRSKQGRGL